MFQKENLQAELGYSVFRNRMGWSTIMASFRQHRKYRAHSEGWVLIRSCSMLKKKKSSWTCLSFGQLLSFGNGRGKILFSWMISGSRGNGWVLSARKCFFMIISPVSWSGWGIPVTHWCLKWQEEEFVLKSGRRPCTLLCYFCGETWKWRRVALIIVGKAMVLP